MPRTLPLPDRARYPGPGRSSLQSLAGAAGDPQKLFENNVYVYPNPVRNGQAIFNAIPVRDGATIHLRIYTITGTLVLDQDITSTASLSSGT